MSLQEYEQVGKYTFGKLYGETAAEVQSMMDTVYPDMGMWEPQTIYKNQLS
jgi:hypothetical protein